MYFQQYLNVLLLEKSWIKLNIFGKRIESVLWWHKPVDKAALRKTGVRDKELTGYKQLHLWDNTQKGKSLEYRKQKLKNQEKR